MRKLPFYALLLLLVTVLASVNFAQDGRRGRDDDGDDWGGDKRRGRMEEQMASDLGEAKHQDRSRHNVSPDLNPNGLGRPGFALTTGGTTALSAITYHGGAVMNTPAIYIIFYGNWNNTTGSNTPAGKQIILDWAASIGTTGRYNLNSTYGVAAYPTTGTATFGGSTNYVGTTRTRLTDAQILSAIDTTISAGRIPWNPNGVYFLMTSSDVTASSGFCTQYCGWHSASTRSYGRLRYSFVGNSARCLSGCAAQGTVSPNNNPGVDGSISILTHELEETHSDPDLNAWYDASGAENSDKCAWTFGHFQYQTANGAFANVHAGNRDYMIQRGLWHTLSGDFCQVDSTHN